MVKNGPVEPFAKTSDKNAPKATEYEKSQMRMAIQKENRQNFSAVNFCRIFGDFGQFYEQKNRYFFENFSSKFTFVGAKKRFSQLQKSVKYELPRISQILGQ